MLAKAPFRETGVQDFCREGHARHMGVTLENGVEMHNFYVPAGGDIPDPKANGKCAHKLHFLAGMEKFFAKRMTISDPVILVGDPERRAAGERRVSHKQLLNIVSHTPVETKLLGEAQAALDWIDTHPPLHSAGRKRSTAGGATRAADWEASDRGRRLDHVWASQGLKGTFKSHKIVKKMRGWQKASDHVPVVVEFQV